MELRILTPHEDKNNPLFESPDSRLLLDMYEDYYPQTGFNLPWVAYLVVRDQQVVGTCSFVGQPKEGKVEIAYWTFKAYEGQGIASFACKALLKIAQAADPKVMVTAKTAPEHNASTKILQHNNFMFTEIVKDEEIGDAWLWVLNTGNNN